MLKRIFGIIEKTEITLKQWIFGFLGILFIRFLLENISSNTLTGVIGSDASTLLHYYLFYLATASCLIIVLGYFVPSKRSVIPKIILFGLTITWIPPVFDLIVTGGSGSGMAYVFASGSELLMSYLTFFGPLVDPGITLGIRLEVLIIALMFFLYVKENVKSFWKSALAAVAAYSSIFFWVALPSFVVLVRDLLRFEIGESASVLVFFWENSALSVLNGNFLHSTVRLVPPERYIEVFFNVSISHVYYFAIPILLAHLYFWRDKKKFIALFKNSRPARVLHYWFMIGLGILLASWFTVGEIAWVWPDVTSLVILMLSFYFAWMFAVGVNDVEDVAIDSISNKNRPLINRELSVSDLKQSNIFFLSWAILGGFLVGHYALFMILAFTAAYYIYSAEPLKLKRVPMVSSFLIAIAGLSAVMAGFFTFGFEMRMDAFPFNWAVLIAVGLTLAVNMRDLKDVEGDAKEGIQTIPVIYKGQLGKNIVGVMLALSFLIIPVLSGMIDIYFIAMPAALFSYWAAVHNPYKEKYIFMIYFAFLLSTAVLLIF